MTNRADVVEAMHEQMIAVGVGGAGQNAANNALDAALPMVWRAVRKYGLSGAMAVLGGADPSEQVAEAAARAMGAGNTE